MGTRMLGHGFAQVGDVRPEVARGAVQAHVPQHLHDGGQGTAVGEQGGGHAGAEQVRILPCPRPLSCGTAHGVVIGSVAQGSTGIAANDAPDACTAMQGSSMSRNPQRRAFTRTSSCSHDQIALKHCMQFAAYWHPSASSTFATGYVQCVIPNISTAKIQKFGSAQARFPQRTHDQAIPKTKEAGQIGRGDHGKYLAITEGANDALRFPAIGRTVIRFSLRRQAKQCQGVIEGSQSLQIDIDRSCRGALLAPRSKPSVQQVGFKPIDCAAKRKPSTRDSDIQTDRRRRSTTGQDARKSRQRILLIHLFQRLPCARAGNLTVTSRYHTYAPNLGPTKAEELLTKQYVMCNRVGYFT